MAKVEIYTKDWCPYCARAKATLTQLGVTFEEIDVTTDTNLEQEMISRSRRTSVPQVFVDGRHIGGSDDLDSTIAGDQFNRLLKGRDYRSVTG